MYYEDDDSDEYAIAELLRESILETIFSYLTLTELRNCALVCKTWYRILNDGNNYVWRYQCAMRLPPHVVKSELLSTVKTYQAKLRAFMHAWNQYDCSSNIYIKPNGFTLHRNPVAQSTDGCRGKIGFISGRHAWEIIWDGPLGTVAMIGVSTENADLQYQGYVALLGSNAQSWGWNLVDNQLLHRGTTQGNFPSSRNFPKYQKRNQSSYIDTKLKGGGLRFLLSGMEPEPEAESEAKISERIRVILDCENHTLSFERNDEFLGVAFRGLPHRKLYPTVSAVYGNTEVSMVYLGPPLDG